MIPESSQCIILRQVLAQNPNSSNTSNNLRNSIWTNSITHPAPRNGAGPTLTPTPCCKYTSQRGPRTTPYPGPVWARVPIPAPCTGAGSRAPKVTYDVTALCRFGAAHQHRRAPLYLRRSTGAGLRAPRCLPTESHVSTPAHYTGADKSTPTVSDRHAPSWTLGPLLPKNTRLPRRSG